ncbi:MAG TPA: NAD(P)H-binding protein [Chitinophagaceae bacterium]|nr:NAD(P)H-binding protein [Chitinophagaceae bacterium]
MPGKTATLIGATGMIGNYLREMLWKSEQFDIIRLIVRRPVEKKDLKEEIKLVDFSNTESFKLAIEGTDTLFCCIGTTNKKVKGDNTLYHAIDHDIPANAARYCKETGCGKFIIITSVGANAKSRNFYLRLKGEVEDAIKANGPASIHVFQPGMLLGKREEKRRGEKFMQGLTRFLSGALFGSLRKYRSIQGKTVAKAMLNAAKKEDNGFFVYTYDQIKKLAE